MKLRLKKDVLSHRFECQPDRNAARFTPPDSAILERNARNAVTEASFISDASSNSPDVFISKASSNSPEICPAVTVNKRSDMVDLSIASDAETACYDSPFSVVTPVNQKYLINSLLSCSSSKSIPVPLSKQSATLSNSLSDDSCLFDSQVDSFSSQSSLLSSTPSLSVLSLSHLPSPLSSRSSTLSSLSSIGSFSQPSTRSIGIQLAEDIANFEWYKYTQSLGLPGRMQLKPDAIPRLVQVVLEEPKKKKRKIKKKKENEEVESSDVKPKENEEVVHIKVENIDVEEDVPQEGANSDVLEETEVDPFSEVANNDFMRPVKNVVSNKDEEDTHFEIADNDFTCQVKNCCSKSPALAFSKVWTLECIPTPTLEVSKKRKQPFLTS